MQLEEYLKQKNISQRDFAKQLGLHETKLSLILNGKRKIHIREVSDIAKLTKFKVKAEDWLEKDAKL